MLFFINTPDEKVLERIRLIGADQDKLLLLVGDAVALATPHWEPRLAELGADEVFAAKDAVQARALEVGDQCEVVDYDEMVDLLLDSGEKVVSL